MLAVCPALAVTVVLSLGQQPAASAPTPPANLQPPADLVQQDTVVQGLVRALRTSQWETALSYCSPAVKDAAKEYSSPEAFFRAVVPIEKVVTSTRNPIYFPSSSSHPSKNPWGSYSFAYVIAELEKDPAIPWDLIMRPSKVYWQGYLKQVSSHWVVDFPTTPPGAL